MTTPLTPSGEHAASLEYLKEYGRVVIDVTNLLEAFDARKIEGERETTFSFYAIDEPFSIPPSIEDRVGSVDSADITYTHDKTNDIVIELFGENGTYAVKRTEGDDVGILPDAHFKFTPLNSIEQSLMSDDDRKKLPRVQSDGEEIDHILEKVPTISNAEFITLLMEITHPGITKNFTSKKENQLQESYVFDSTIYDPLYESSRITSFSQRGNLHYELLSATGATLSYFYEAGQPASFFVSAPDDITGETVKVMGHVSKDVSIEAPRPAVSLGETSDWPVPSVLHDGPTLRELKLIHEVLTEELQSLPDIPDAFEGSIEMDSVAVIDNKIDVIERRVDKNRKEAEEGTDDKAILLDLEYFNLNNDYPDGPDEITA
ncbi:MAG: hypothetical protein V4611_00765 [Patescibacteria group bacterium]